MLILIQFHGITVVTCNGVQHKANAMITTMIILVTRILFSFPLHLFRVSRAGPGPWVAALPRHNLNSMFMYSQRIVSNGSTNIVTKTTTCFVDKKKKQFKNDLVFFVTVAIYMVG